MKIKSLEFHTISRTQCKFSHLSLHKKQLKTSTYLCATYLVFPTPSTFMGRLVSRTYYVVSPSLCCSHLQTGNYVISPIFFSRSRLTLKPLLFLQYNNIYQKRIVIAQVVKFYNIIILKRCNTFLYLRDGMELWLLW